MDTPFIYNRYTTGKFFVGRKNECSILTNLLKKNENVVLYSPPKTGKMSVIQQTLYNMRSGGHRFRIAHARMFNIESVNSFATKFGEAVIRACGNSPADYKNIISTYLDALFIQDLSIRFENSLEERYMNVCYYLHIYLNIKFLITGPDLESRTSISSFSRYSFIFCTNTSLWK
jgi:AAA+ ATPase superfamily predicted ATPase